MIGSVFLRLLVILLACFGAARAQTLSVAAAVSLSEAITAAGDEFQKSGGPTIEFAFGGSGQLLAQIRSGAPIDLFISAATREMDQLQKNDLIVADTRRDVAANKLVLIATPSSLLSSVSQLTGAAVRRIAVGESQSVPAGLYAEQTLQSLKLLDTLQPKIVFGSNVRQVLDYVAAGNADAGFVYATDAKQAGQSVRVVETIDGKLHDPIVYPAAVLARSPHVADAKRFLDFLGSSAARGEFARRGFLPPAATHAATRP